MTQEFRRSHLIHAALQQRGAPQSFIREFLAKLEDLATSPEDFQKWNQLLDDRGIQLLTMMLTPKGDSLCDTILEDLFSSIVKHYSISPEELQTMSKFN